MRSILTILLTLAVLSAFVPAAIGQSRDEEPKIVDFEADIMRPINVGDSSVLNLLGNVVLHHNEAVITCDSAIRYNDKRMECFKRVVINKGTTYVYGDRADYNGDINTAKVYAPIIKMVDGDATLYTYHFSFNTLDNIGEFHGGGTMTQGDNLMESRRGYYYVDTRDFIGVDEVELSNPDYMLMSDSVSYNLDDEIASFYTKSYIWNSKGEILSAERGRYFHKTAEYRFTTRGYILTEDQEVWADSIDYNSETENAILRQDVQIRDEEQKVLAFGDYGQYWGGMENAMMTRNPSLVSFDPEQDSLYMRADSIFFLTYHIDHDFDAEPEQPEMPGLGGESGTAGMFSPSDSLAMATRIMNEAASEDNSDGLDSETSDGDAGEISLDQDYADDETDTGPPGRDDGSGLTDDSDGETIPSDGESGDAEETQQLRVSAGDEQPDTDTDPAPDTTQNGTRVQTDDGIDASEAGVETAAAQAIEAAGESARTKAEIKQERAERRQQEKEAKKAAKQRTKTTEDNVISEIGENDRVEPRVEPAPVPEIADGPTDTDYENSDDVNGEFADHSINHPIQKTEAVLPDSTQLSAIGSMISGLGDRSNAGVEPTSTDGTEPTDTESDGEPQYEEVIDPETGEVTMRLREDNLLASDSLAVEIPVNEGDTLQRVTKGYYNVRIFREDFQAVCDSIVGFSRDTTMYLYIDPVLWNSENQVVSDIMEIYTKNEQLDRAVFIGRPFMSSEVDPLHYNQVKGKQMEAFFRDNEIYKHNVVGNGETYYYMEDDETGDVMGFLVAECADITFLIEDRQMDRIIYRGDPVYTIYPMDKIPLTQELFLPGFKWEAERRPTLADVFDRTIRASEREFFEALPTPQFPLTESIMADKEDKIERGIWRERNDTLSPQALEFLRYLANEARDN